MEEVFQTATLTQAAQGLKAGFHGQPFVDDNPHGL
jgi:hypothetical protein